MKKDKDLKEVCLAYDLDSLIRFQQAAVDSIKELDGLPKEDRIEIAEINQDILTVLKTFKDNCVVGSHEIVNDFPLAFYNNQEIN